ncbi:unnamed protein product [Caenorhabditis angaria]|uniref:Equilibrative nucleoside transporter 1 n=1 Tax=Caenorhabditis angaria TaxID=860376 RepID=A0A9P1IQP6_9PELO|nr:unnamed protein product [Caenorhabditis angaria]
MKPRKYGSLQMTIIFEDSQKKELDMSNDSQSAIISTSEENEEDERNVPKDRMNLVFWIILLNGVGVLLPWNMFITIAPQYYVDYWFTVNGTKTSYADNFMSAMGIVSQIPNMIVAIINVLNIIRGPLLYRIISPLTFNSSLILIILGLVIFQNPSDAARNWFYIVSLIIIMAMNASNGLYQNSFFGLAADFPAKYSNAVVIGTNICGTFTSVLAIVATLVFASQPKMVALVYFSISFAILIICLISWWFCKKLSFFNYYIEKGNRARAAQENTKFDYRLYLKTFKYCWKQYLSVFFVYFVTLSVFPTILVGFVPNYTVFPSDIYAGITTFLNFNLFAAVGSTTADFIKFPGPDFLIIPCLIRLLFIPFFMFSNYLPDQRSMFVLYSNEWIFFFGNTIMAFTSGYFSSLGMMYSPRVCPPELSKLAGQISALCLVAGIAAGVGFTPLITVMVKSF